MKNTFMSKYYKLIAVLILVVFLELVVFQFRSLESTSFKTISWEELLEKGATFSDDITSEPKNGVVTYQSNAEEVRLTLKNLNCVVKNLYLDVSLLDSSGQSMPLTVNLSATDKGHTFPFSLPERTISPSSVRRSRYLRLHLSGNADYLEINFQNPDKGTMVIRSVSLNTPVPYQPQPLRLLLMAALAALFFLLHPNSSLHRIPLFDANRTQISPRCMNWISAFCLILCLLTTLFCLSNSKYVSPSWPHHKQYQKLAVSLSEGHLYLDDEVPESLMAMDNPYDTTLRDSIMEETNEHYIWDAAYYNGHYYVYFGVVPVLCFYLPYYLLTHNAFPNVMAVMISGWFAILAIFWMTSQLCKRFFHDISLGFYLLFSLLFVSGSYLFLIFFQASFYTLPILMGLMFHFTGLGCWFQASELLRQERPARLSLFLGSLCMALVAGCRPQLLLGSLFAFPLFGGYIQGIVRPDKRFPKFGTHLLAIVFPFVAVALALFWYNAARFGSPFDFGANYNLTTNDMTSRGFVWERLPLGIWRYLFQPANVTNSFPYLTYTTSENTYLGQTIQETMYGGAFTCNLFCWVLLGWKKAWKSMKREQLSSFFLISVISALVIVCADTTMAGLLERYMTDFAWLLIFAGILVTIGLCRTYPQHTNVTVFFCFISLFATAAYQLLIGVSRAGLTDVSLTYFFEFWL